MPLMNLTACQPGKAVWTLIALAFNAARLPLWMLMFLPSRFRQNPKWTFRQALSVRALRAFLWNVSIVKMRVPCSLLPGEEKNRFVVCDPASSQYFTGCLTQDEKIKPGQVGGTWYPKPLSNSEERSSSRYVILHLHGGAYVIGDGRTKDAGFAAQTFLRETDVEYVFAAQYRIASAKDSRFPAQLQDAVTAYCHLLFELKIPASRIIVSGDSAGGHLALGLLRYLSDHGAETNLPDPACAWIWSGWVSPHLSNISPGSAARNSNSSTDYITDAFGEWGSSCLAPEFSSLHPEADEKISKSSLNHPYLDFYSYPFGSKTPICFIAGSCEILLQLIVSTYESFRKFSPDNKVEIEVIKEAPHDFLLTGNLLGFRDEAVEGVRRANQYLRSVTKGPSDGMAAARI